MMMLCLSMLGMVLLLASGALAYGYWRLFQKTTQHAAALQKIQQQLAQHAKEQNILVNADLSFSKQMSEFNRHLISLESELQGMVTKRDNDGGYQHALRILAMGGDKSEIMENCHLSNAEAELLMNLNAYRAAIKPERIS